MHPHVVLLLKKPPESMKEYLQFLREYFSAENELPKDFAYRNYFESGWIDSFGIILLIEELEQAFGLKFNELHFQDRRFATSIGIAEIIAEIKGE